MNDKDLKTELIDEFDRLIEGVGNINLNDTTKIMNCRYRIMAFKISFPKIEYYMTITIEHNFKEPYQVAEECKRSLNMIELPER